MKSDDGALSDVNAYGEDVSQLFFPFKADGWAGQALRSGGRCDGAPGHDLFLSVFDGGSASLLPGIFQDRLDARANPCSSNQPRSPAGQGHAPARRLAEDGPEALRLRAEIGGSLVGDVESKGGVLAALRRSPLVDIEFERDRTTGRDVDL